MNFRSIQRQQFLLFHHSKVSAQSMLSKEKFYRNPNDQRHMPTHPSLLCKRSSGALVHRQIGWIYRLLQAFVLLSSNKITKFIRYIHPYKLINVYSAILYGNNIVDIHGWTTSNIFKSALFYQSNQKPKPYEKNHLSHRCYMLFL